MDVNKESHFFETASIFEENWIERNTVNALRSQASRVGMGVLVQMDRLKCLNPWDCQSKRQYMIDGVYPALNAGNGAGGQAHGVCYAVGGPRNGFYETECSRALDINCGNPGCNQGGMVVLHKAQITQDKHAVCYQNTGQGYWQSHDVAETLRVAPASQYENLCCYDARGNGDGLVCPTMTGDHENRITDYTSVVVIDHSRRHSYQPLDIVPTMEAHMGTGGGNVPMILVENNNESISKEHRSIVREDG